LLIRQKGGGMEEWLFQGWSGILRISVVAVLSYIGLVALLRISGKRTLAKLNAFDLVVTVAMGSTLASMLLSKNVALAEGMTAFVLLISLQYVVAWLSVRSDRFAELVRSDAALLVRNGEMCRGTMRRERITEEEVLTVIRQSSASDPDDVTAVILETDGSFSVIGRQADGSPATYTHAGLSGRGN
jgi:uncharacterized membrane protein YcaP (DUF421 family)